MTGYEAYAVYAYYAAAAVAAYGAVTTAQTQSANAKAQAQAQEYNAAVAAQNAEIARRNAGAKEDAFRSESRQFLAKQRAAAVQTGFDSATGSMALLLEQSADFAEVDALMIRRSGEQEARGFSEQAILDGYGAGVSRSNASAARRAGYVSASSTLLSSASRGYGSGIVPGGSGGGPNAAQGVRIPTGGY